MGSPAGPRASEDRTTDGTASDTGLVIVVGVEAETGMTNLPASTSGTVPKSFWILASLRWYFRHSLQSSPDSQPHCGGFGNTCSMATMDTESAGEMTSSSCGRAERARRGGVRTEADLGGGTEAEINRSLENMLLLRRCWIELITRWRLPNEVMSSSFRSSNCRSRSTRPEMSWVKNFSTTLSSKPASCIQSAT